MTSQSLISELSFPSNNCKTLKPPLQNLAGSLSSLTAEDPPRTPRSLARAPDQTRTRGYTADDSGAGSIFLEPARKPSRNRGAEADPAGVPRPQRARGHIPRVAQTARQVRVHAESRPGQLRRFETRSSGVGIPARSTSLPALAPHSGHPRTDAPTRPRTASSPPARGTAPRGAASLRAEHSPWSPSPDLQATPLLRVLNPKLPRSSDGSRPSGPGWIGSGRHLRESTTSPRPPRLRSRPERSDNSGTGSANEADLPAEETWLRREAGPGGGRGGAGLGSPPPRRAGRPNP